MASRLRWSHGFSVTPAIDITGLSTWKVWSASGIFDMMLST